MNFCLIQEWPTIFSRGKESKNIRAKGPGTESPENCLLTGKGVREFLIIFARGCQRVCLSVSLFASKRLILMSWLKIRV